MFKKIEKNNKKNRSISPQTKPQLFIALRTNCQTLDFFVFTIEILTLYAIRSSKLSRQSATVSCIFFVATIIIIITPQKKKPTNAFESSISTTKIYNTHFFLYTTTHSLLLVIFCFCSLTYNSFAAGVCVCVWGRLSNKCHQQMGLKCTF